MYEFYRLKCKFYRLKCVVYRIKCKSYRLKCEFCRLKCKFYRLKCQIYRLKCEKQKKLKSVKVALDTLPFPIKNVLDILLLYDLSVLLCY